MRCHLLRAEAWCVIKDLLWSKSHANFDAHLSFTILRNLVKDALLLGLIRWFQKKTRYKTNYENFNQVNSLSIYVNPVGGKAEI